MAPVLGLLAGLLAPGGVPPWMTVASMAIIILWAGAARSHQKTAAAWRKFYLDRVTEDRDA